MRRVFYSLLPLLLCLSQCSGTALASDWVEDDQAPARYVNQQTPAPPPLAPDYDSNRLQRPQYSQGAPDEKKTAFVVDPSAKQSGSAVLEGGVSQWGMNGRTNSANSNLQGTAWANQRNLMPQKPTPAIVPPSTFRNWLQSTHPEFALKTSAMPDESVINVKGQWDDSTKPLHALGIHYKSVGKGDLRNLPLDNVKVMIVNCPGRVPEEAFQRIRDWVARGGYLLTTDWALADVLQRAFPGYVEFTGQKAEQTMVDAIVTDPDPSLFAGAVPRAYWKVDAGSEMLRVLRPGAVHVLVRSNQLLSEDNDRQGILAVAFQFGRGKVLHLVGHFDNNSMLPFMNSLPDPAPGIGISLRQALASNFVVEGLSK